MKQNLSESKRNLQLQRDFTTSLSVTDIKLVELVRRHKISMNTKYFDQHYLPN